ncbi:hypothetical protein [Peptostreptococcus anaerobius]|uniref:Uncharacterized protein n=1 Tax=Peptostreptococcus anaerobius TaxID=1261 RepID=A0A135YPS4_9FIRM|nr:hypothetical protein [Peptostreptococcus anaerobius]KXI11419.1 hypothetical protein HMPREF3195_01396 [Peptostreptococcus anaerobius]
MKVNLKARDNTINIGDVVEYEDAMYVVGIGENEIFLFNLKTSYVQSLGIGIENINPVNGFELVAKSKDVVIQQDYVR